MPNGISCAYFAIKNRINADEQDNGIKGVISDIQGLRSVDALAEGVREAGVMTEHIAKVSAPLSNFLGKAAGLFKKLVYPLIVTSGVYETLRSEDKVKTGVKTASAISTMYTFEKVAEFGLNKFKDMTSKNRVIENNKKLKFLMYFLRGTAFVAASITGYGTGKKIGAELVDEIRHKKGIGIQPEKSPAKEFEKEQGVSAVNYHKSPPNKAFDDIFVPGVAFASEKDKSW